MPNKINWGIIGLGQIAAQFAGSLMARNDAAIAAVVSRSPEKAAGFAVACGARPFSSISDMLAQDGVDIVYIASPHVLHKEQAHLCLQAGKAVLIEKPVAANAADAQAIADEAAKSGRFAMEALWTRFLPAVREAKHLVEAGRIGRLTGFQGHLSFRHIYHPASRLFDPALGGGALLDIGVYPLSLAVHFLGPVRSATGQVLTAPSGVDRQASLTLEHRDGLASVSCGFDGLGANDAVLIGETGRIRLQQPLYAPAALTLSPGASGEDASSDSISLPQKSGMGRRFAWNQLLRPVRQGRFRPLPFRGNGFVDQIDEVHRCLIAGLTQSPVMPLKESVEVLSIIEAVLQGRRYIA